MGPELQRGVEIHLRALTESPAFARAPIQAKALEFMVRASLDGRDLSGSELAQDVYGRADENYVRAVRQLARELRLKLPLVYRSGERYPVRFELHPHHYAVQVVFAPSEMATPIEAAHAPQQRRSVWALGLAAITVVCAGAMAAISWSQRGATKLEAPQRIEIVDDTLVFMNAAGKPIPGWRERLEAIAGYPFRPEEQSLGMKTWANATVLEGGSAGRPRVAAATCNPFEPGRCALHLLTADGRRELGSFELPRLPQGVGAAARLHEVQGETFVPDWMIESIAAADLDGDGVRDEVLLGVRSWRLFPSQTLGLDFDGTWHVLVDYWNMGTTHVVPLPDLDGDGRDEIAIYGENNSYQRGVVTLLASKQGFPVGARSPDGYRLARLAELERYPFAGLTFQFPFTDLPAGPKPALRSLANELAWDAAGGVLHVGVLDAALNPGTGERWRVAFRLESGPAPSSAFIQEYDSALATFRRQIASGELRDRWNIMTTERLTDYGLDLASRIQVWNARDPLPSWRPIRAGELSSVFPTAATVAAAR